ncbi:MAG: hypothetical protein ACRD2S_06470, partial [Terriglobales bacterium]
MNDGKMSRYLTSVASGLFLVLGLAFSASATPIVGGAIQVSQSSKASGGALFHSSLKGQANSVGLE